MGKYRLYPTKSNTLIQNSNINTGENEVMELWYGLSGVTRHLVKFDFSEYYDKYSSGFVPHITAATTTFHMNNCYPFLEKDPYYSSEIGASSVITVKTIQQNWDSGNGHDFYGLRTENGYSNWYCATTVNTWAAPGGDFLYEVFSGAIDKGYESFSGVITDEIRLWEQFTGSNHGLAVMFTDDYEVLSSNSHTILKFYTENVQTTYKKPYIEITWENQVKDERNSVYSGETSRLYLYTKLNGVFTNVYDVSGVSISYSTSGLTPFTSTTINNTLPGIYYVDFVCSTGATGGTVFTDTWQVKYTSGGSYQSVSQSGTVVEVGSVWSSNDSDVINSNGYSLSIPSLREKYSKGENIYMQINAHTNYTSTNNILKSMEYKLDLVDGDNRITMIDWDPVSYTTSENFIMIDTDWLLSGYQYSLSFKYTKDGSTIIDNDIERKFWIS